MAKFSEKLVKFGRKLQKKTKFKKFNHRRRILCIFNKVKNIGQKIYRASSARKSS